MTLTGMDDLFDEFDKITERLRQGLARHAYESAEFTRDRALQNMSLMNIGLVTGRSRALYGVRAGDALFGTEASVAAYAGYLKWPGDVVFYPEFLNEGTVKMGARPYHDLAVEQGEKFFNDGTKRVLDYALTGRWTA